jgi:hypothetical protein
MALVSAAECNRYLVGRHYLGPTKASGWGWRDKYGVMLFAAPRSRRLPGDWLELVRWCLSGEPNAGSRQWASFSAWARKHHQASTVVSYSDPSQGHTGALYRACNWWWAPTWHRLRPPPTGNGEWTSGKSQSVKDRWVFPLARDPRRVSVLAMDDGAVLRRFPWALYREPGGADYRAFKARLPPSVALGGGLRLNSHENCSMPTRAAEGHEGAER